jgi:hypothetical protein
VPHRHAETKNESPTSLANEEARALSLAPRLQLPSFRAGRLWLVGCARPRVRARVQPTALAGSSCATSFTLLFGSGLLPPAIAFSCLALSNILPSPITSATSSFNVAVHQRNPVPFQFKTE